MEFAETAAEAWSGPRGPAERARSLARAAVLRMAALRAAPPEGDFVRCLYSHAAFPETAPKIRAFVRALKNVGDFIDTPTLLAMIREGKPVSGRHFHLSFDDGFANVFEAGGEIFEAEKVPYTIFVATDLIEADAPTIAGYFRTMTAYRRPVRTMSWAQVREAAQGIGEIGCHTRSHARLSGISANPPALEAEIAGAKAILEEKTGRPCTSFAWPYGTMADIDAPARAAIAAAGFDICFSAVRGTVDPSTADPMNVPRHQVEFHWPMHELMLWARGYRE